MRNQALSLLLLLLCLFTATSVTGQSDPYKGRLSIGAGVVTAPDILEVTGSFSTIIISGGTVYTDNITSTGAAFVNYDRLLTPAIMVGTGFTYSRLKRDLMVKSDDKPLKAGTGSSDYYSFMARFHHCWLNGEFVRIYYGAGFGFSIVHDQADIEARYKPENTSQNSFHVAFQITPLGFEVGKTFSVFAEMGLGFNGLFSAGLAYKLK